MAVAGFVVLRRTPLQGVGNCRDGDAPRPVRFGFHGHGGHFQSVQGDPGVAVGDVDQMGKSIVRQLQRQLPQTAKFVGEGARNDVLYCVLVQRKKREHAAAGQQRRVDLKGRVFGGGPDESDGSVLHVGKDDVLLGLVETMDLVHKQYGVLPVQRLSLPRLGHRFAQVGDAGRHRADRLKVGAGGIGDEPGQGRFAGAGRSPEQDRWNPVGINRPAQHPVLGEDVTLPHELVKGGRPHPLGQWRDVPDILRSTVLEQTADAMAGGHGWITQPRISY